ncbi:DUF982 domain-containing protein [Rhizobium sp. TRM96647]|uniref:DUF982 domain-containing protein n=1 Tax=unclassified Rhizobium TaxID=2613769 RepID=UPI0021E8A385|nr:MULTISPECIES: DUF982 domain-containing protein [unclassified Rhizobium]MCV3739280.1 DUF982 domain-containing protein [Rhizobium sp. TRM96647]MCV3760970.1 DUF982 domain-containing protein [Rhizobium sp. TRM96650]
MGEVVAVQMKAHWSMPVSITTPQRLIKVVRGPEEAHAALMHAWPDGVHRDRFLSAKRACIAALCGRQTPQYARTMFVYACQEARIPYREGNLPL